MVDEGQIKKWVKDGTITQAQAKKMLAETSSKSSDDKSNKFLATISIIGAVLIFIGFAWLIAKNWHQIPSFLKVIILVLVTISAFVSGVLLREKNHEGVGRSLITLGALLFILSLFLISQIYGLASSVEHYAIILFIAWVVIVVTAYVLDSPENLVVGMIVFFCWAILKYTASVSHLYQASVFTFILLLLGAGALLFGLCIFHGSINHKFTHIYLFWTVLYFLIIFYVLSFQSLLPVLSQSSLDLVYFSPFLIIFLLVCLGVLITAAVLAMKKNSGVVREVLVFVAIIIIILSLILLTKLGEKDAGTCYAKGCYDFNNQEQCASAPSEFNCDWINVSWRSGSYCTEISCYNYGESEEKCAAAKAELKCYWQDNYCYSNITQPVSFYNLYERCNAYVNNHDACVSDNVCKWQAPGFFDMPNGGLPPILWLLWIVNNLVFIGFIVLIIWYGQQVGSSKIINLALFIFILDIISRYIGFWMDFKGYFAFSLLAILGGLLLIVGAWQFPKFRRKLLAKTNEGRK